MMKKWVSGLCLLAGWICTGASAQNWTAFIPAERDFRVLFPDRPVDSTEADGTVVYKTGDEIEYMVYRHTTRLASDADVAAVIARRLQTVYGEDRPVVQITDDDQIQPVPGQYVFRVGGRGGTYSIHRVFLGGGRFYELVVRSRASNRATAAQTAGDFFGTFQTARGGRFLATTVPGGALDQLCRDRADKFSRAFCEFRACFHADYATQPNCARLFGR